MSAGQRPWSTWPSKPRALVALVGLLFATACGGDALCTPTESSCLVSSPMTSEAEAPALASMLVLTPTDVAWTAQAGDGPWLITPIGIANTGDGALGSVAVSVDYAREPQGWLHTSFTLSNEPVELLLSADPTGLPVGTHVAEVILTAPSASNSPQEVRVVLEITPPPGPPVLEFRRPPDQYVLQGDQPPPTHFYVVNTGETSTNIRFEHPSGPLSSIPTPLVAWIPAGDSARFVTQMFVEPTLPPGSVVESIWRYHWFVDGVEDAATTGLRVHVNPHIVGGTVDNSDGTVFVWEGTGSDGNCCVDVRLTGPAGWNGGSALPVERRQPIGINPRLAIGWTDAAPADGEYRAAHPGSSTPWTWTIDASQQVAPRVINHASSTPPKGYTVRWDPSPAGGSTLVNLYDEAFNLRHEEMVPPGVNSLTIPETVWLHESNLVEVIAFNVDLTSATLPTTQVNMASSLARVLKPTVGGVLQLRPANLDFTTTATSSPPPQTIWGHNTGTALLVGHTYQHSNNFHGVSPSSFSIQPGDSVQFTVNAFPARPPGTWTDETLFLPEVYPDAPEWEAVALKITLVITPDS